MLRFSPIDFMVRPDDFFVALLYIEYGLLQLGFQFRNFDHGNCLSLMYPVADVDVDALHIAADFRMNIHDLVRLKLASQREYLRDVAPLCSRNLCRCNGGCVGFGGGAARVAGG